MASKNDAKWHQNYEALKVYILQRGHLPDKHVVENRALLSWTKYQRKKIKEGTLDAEKRELFELLLATRSNEHTGEEGRKPKWAISDDLVFYEDRDLGQNSRIR